MNRGVEGVGRRGSTGGIQVPVGVQSGRPGKIKRGEADILATSSGDLQEEKITTTKGNSVAGKPARDGNVNESRMDTNVQTHSI